MPTLNSALVFLLEGVLRACLVIIGQHQEEQLSDSLIERPSWPGKRKSLKKRRNFAIIWRSFNSSDTPPKTSFTYVLLLRLPRARAQEIRAPPSSVDSSAE